jgi:hypothetical protein
MIDSYWDLYVAYVNKCVRDNWANDIDPNHYKMEWNHWLPKACFPDLPVGQWLTLRQHAIASALQTLALRKNCMCGWHKKHLPAELLRLSWGYYGKMSSETLKKTHAEHRVGNKSSIGLKNGRRNAAKLNAEKDEFGRSANAMKCHEVKDEFGRSLHALRLHEEKDEFGRSVRAMKTIRKVHEKKDEFGRSVRGVKAAEKMHAEKDEFGRSVNAIKAGKKTHEEKDELGRSVNGVRAAGRMNSEKDEFGRSVTAMKTNTQVWESTIDGFRSHSGGVALHNKANGWDPGARIRVG